MIVRLSPRIMASAVVLILPLAAYSQTDPSLKLSTTSATAASEFRVGVTDWQNSSRDAASLHFKAAIDADPAFGLARVFFAIVTRMDSAQRKTELDRGMADASRASINEKAIADAYRATFLGETDSAMKLFRVASELMPRDPLFTWGAAGGFNAPLATTRSFVATHPDYPLALNQLAYQLWFAGDRAGALAVAKHQVEVLPNVSNSHDTYAELLQWNGNFTEATAHYTRAASFTPKYPEAYAGLAEVAALQGQDDQARTYLKQAVANAWSPLQKARYTHQIAGTHVLSFTEFGIGFFLLEDEINAATETATGDALEEYRITLQELAGYRAIRNAKSGDTTSFKRSVGHTMRQNQIPPIAAYFDGMGYGILGKMPQAIGLLRYLKAVATKQPGSVPPELIAALDANLFTKSGRPADALLVLMAQDTTNVLVMSHIAEAHSALGHVAEYHAWTKKITANHAIALGDFSDLYARSRATLGPGF